MFGLIRGIISVYLIRCGKLKSPSLSAYNWNPADYDARVTRNGITWQNKRHKKARTLIVWQSIFTIKRG